MIALKRNRAVFYVTVGCIVAVVFVFLPLCGNVPYAEAGAKTKTIVYFVGSIASTTAIVSATTSTFNFTINIPDIVPTSQPIRSAYILYNTHISTTAFTASKFTLNKQGGSAQTLTGVTAISNSGEPNQFAMRLNATAAMQTLIGNASGTYAMTFTANITGPTRDNEGAELYLTYDYDPFAPTQINTVYNFVYATSTQIGTTLITSPTFNFNLPESSVTSTFNVGASSTNHFWIEYRGYVTVAATLTEGWDSETTSTFSYVNAATTHGFLLLVPPKTANASPSANHTFKMLSSIAAGINGANAIAVATYTFDFNASTKFRRTLQTTLMQSTLTASTSTINTTSTINIPESSPSSTSAFLVGRTVFVTTAANPGINATTTSAGCTFPLTTTPITMAFAGETAGFPTVAWDVTAGLRFNTSGTKTVCSSFTTGAAANVRGLMLFWNYDYAKLTTAGSSFNQNVSFLAGSNTTAGTSFSNNINAAVANASSTKQNSWLNATFVDSRTGTLVALTFTIGTQSSTNGFAFLTTGEGTLGEVFSTSTPSGLDSSVTSTLNCSLTCVNNASYNVWFRTDIIAANLTQVHYHWRNNNGSESAATAAANEDTSTSTAASTIYRLRFEISNAGDATSSAAFRIKYQQNATSGAWTQLATSTVGTAHWQMATSSQVSDGTATTDIATSTYGGTTNANIFFVAGEVVASTSRNQAATTTLTGTQFTEVEYAIKATSNVVEGAIYYFQLTDAGAALTTYAIYASSTVPAGNTPPTVLNVVLHNGSPIILDPNTTKAITVVASTTDPNGPGDLRYATSTIYRSGVGATCAADDLNCYQLASSSCAFADSTSTINCTANIRYFAQATDSSSTYPSENWLSKITVTDSVNNTSSSISSVGVELNTLLAINITTSSINYGSLGAGNNSGSTNQSTTIQNAGNSSVTLQIYGSDLAFSSNILAVDNQRYSTSTFTYPGATSTALTSSNVLVSGFFLVPPTSTNAVSSPLYWGMQVTSGTPVGIYNGTTTFTAVWSQ